MDGLEKSDILSYNWSYLILISKQGENVPTRVCSFPDLLDTIVGASPPKTPDCRNAAYIPFVCDKRNAGCRAGNPVSIFQRRGKFINYGGKKVYNVI